MRFSPLHGEVIRGLIEGKLAPLLFGVAKKSRQRRSRQFSVLTYYQYAPRTKLVAALLDELF